MTCCNECLNLVPVEEVGCFPGWEYFGCLDDSDLLFRDDYLLFVYEPDGKLFENGNEIYLGIAGERGSS